MKKAQITIYIILGVIILIGAGVFVFLQQDTVESAIKTEFPSSVEFAGQQEVRSFMDQCLTDSAFNGVEILRLQGGHIDIPSKIPTVRIKNNDNLQIYTDNGVKKVKVDPTGSGNDVAYWLDSNDKIFIPSEGYVEKQLANYVKNSISKCVNNFDAFKEQNYEVTTGNLETSVELSDEVLIKVNYPITFEKGDVIFSENEFLLRIPVNIKKALDVGLEIAMVERDGAYLEFNIKNLISLYGFSGANLQASDNIRDNVNTINKLGSADSGLPPLTYTDANLDCAYVTWTVEDVKDRLKNNFKQNFAFISVAGYGDNRPDDNSQVAKGVYDSMTFDIVNEGYDNTEIDFYYDPTTSMELDIKPRIGNVIKPHIHRASGLKLLPLFCNVRYQFKYTMKFPAFARIIDTNSNAIDITAKSLNKEKDFEFDIPLGVNLCGNQERECTGRPAYADNLPELDLDKLGFNLPVQTMFCDEDNKKSQPMSITTYDKNTDEKLSNVNIFYRCGTYQDDCLIGTTNEEGVLQAKMPLCMNGQLHVLTEGYGESYELFTTHKGNAQRSFNYKIEPLTELKAEIVMISLPKLIESYYSTQSTTTALSQASLLPNDKYQIIISAEQGPSQFMVAYPGENNNVKLASGSYKFSTMTMGDSEYPEELIIPGGVVEGVDMSGFDKPDTAFLGSYELETEFSYEEINNAQRIIFYAPIESETFDLNAFQYPIAQQDGSLYFKGLINGQEQEVNIPREDVKRMLRPRLE